MHLFDFMNRIGPCCYLVIKKWESINLVHLLNRSQKDILSSCWTYKHQAVGYWIGSRRALLSRKKWSIPACAITSMVPIASWSRLSGVSEVVAGRNKVGPNTVARLWRDILFFTSLLFTLKNKDKSEYHHSFKCN